MTKALNSRFSARALVLGFFLGVLVLLVWNTSATAGGAQDAGGEEPKAAATDGSANAPAANGTTKRPKLLIHMLNSVGWTFGGILLFVSIGLVALIVLLSMELRMNAAIPPGFVE